MGAAEAAAGVGCTAKNTPASGTPAAQQQFARPRLRGFTWAIKGTFLKCYVKTAFFLIKKITSCLSSLRTYALRLRLILPVYVTDRR
jgi:hypothetical protein